jgi:hypothetical protein
MVHFDVEGFYQWLEYVCYFNVYYLPVMRRRSEDPPVKGTSPRLCPVCSERLADVQGRLSHRMMECDLSGRDHVTECESRAVETEAGAGYGISDWGVGMSV